MTRRPTVARHVEALLGVSVTATSPLAGGDTCTATRLRLTDGTLAVVKTMPHAPAGFFEAEARGLRRLGEVDGGAPVPRVLAVDAECLVVSWVEPGRAEPDAAGDLGRALATTHAAGEATWGAPTDGWVGRLPLPNRSLDTWAEFWPARRVLPYLRLARDRGAITPEQAGVIEAVAARTGDLVPEEPPARLHGDLWNGNVLWAGPRPAHLLDPASYGGHREVDLAMLALFGLPQLERVLEAYQDLTPLAAGWEERVGLHQLHPLLAHAAMFGGGYGARAATVAARWA